MGRNGEGRTMIRLTPPILGVIVFTVLQTSIVFGYDDDISHRLLTGVAIAKSKIKERLRHELNMFDGLSTTLNKHSIEWHIKEGSYLEDNELCRRSTHFHNPLKSWEEAGLSYSLLPAIGCTSLYLSTNGYTRHSALTLATGLVDPAKPIIPIRGSIGDVVVEIA